MGFGSRARRELTGAKEGFRTGTCGRREAQEPGGQNRDGCRQVRVPDNLDPDVEQARERPRASCGEDKGPDRRDPIARLPCAAALVSPEGASAMSAVDGLVLARQRHLKWRVLDPLEWILMVLCGFLLLGFSVSVCCDIATRLLGSPWLWLQEVTSTLFVYGIFLGTAAATRRNDHLYLTAFAEA